MDRQRKRNEGTKKLKTNLIDPRLKTDIEKLFDDLRGGELDDYVDSSTILFLLSFLNTAEKEPEFFWYVLSAVEKKDKLSKAEFVNLFMNPPKFRAEDPEDMKTLFKVFDNKNKGSFNSKDFLELMEYSPVYLANPSLVEENVHRSFEGLTKIHGNREITPVEFFHLLTQIKGSK